MDNSTLAFCTLIKIRERNKAIGIGNDTQFVRGLGQFIRHAGDAEIKSTTTQVLGEPYLTALIGEYQDLAQRLTDHIMENLDDDDIRNEGVHAVKSIDAYVTHLAEQLEALWQMT